MHGGAIVPHDKITDLPLVRVYALALRGSLLLDQALAASRPDEKRALAASAAADLGASLAANPNLEAAWEAAAGRARELSGPR